MLEEALKKEGSKAPTVEVTALLQPKPCDVEPADALLVVGGCREESPA
jgi:hypothetical protein